MRAPTSLSALFLATFATFSISAAQAADKPLILKAIGQPLAGGPLQKDKEQPFFEEFAERTGLPIQFDYKPSDTVGINDAEQLRVLKTGLFDVISIRVLRNSRDEPMLAGLDLAGAAPDFPTARKLIDAYSAAVDEQLQKKFNTKLLGVWPYGPQILFCKPEIEDLQDVRGKKVRVTDQNLARLISALGGTPVPMALPEVHQSLALGVVDCAISSPGSANAAGWPEVTNYQFPIGFQSSPNAYGMSLKRWNSFSEEQQAKISAAFDTLINDMWEYAEEIHEDALNCNAGRTPCEKGKPYQMKEVEVTQEDMALLQAQLLETSVPTWAKACEKSKKGCADEWKALVDLD